MLRILRENARTPYVKIARELGVTEAAVRKRVRRLEERGVIRKYTVEVDPRKVGFEVTALIGLDTSPERFMATLEQLQSMEEVLELYSASGDHMILVKAWFRNSRELAAFVRKLESIDGVTRVCPAIILERIK